MLEVTRGRMEMQMETSMVHRGRKTLAFGLQFAALPTRGGSDVSAELPLQTQPEPSMGGFCWLRNIQECTCSHANPTRRYHRLAACKQ